MFIPGNVLYFTPFFFKNGNTAKPKYFVVIDCSGDDTIVASLPTRKNNAPSIVSVDHGCENQDDRNFNCYVYCENRAVCQNGFSFPIRTYIYGNQVDVYSLSLLEQTYKIENVDYEIKGKLTEEEYVALVDCIKNSKSTKNKIKRLIK